MIRGLEPLSYEKRLRAVAVQPGEEKPVGRPYCSLSVLMGAYKKDGDRLFSRSCSDRKRGNDFKLKECRFRLKKKCVTMSMVKPWPRMPRDGRCPIPGNIQGQVDGVLSNLLQWKVSLLAAGRLD